MASFHTTSRRTAVAGVLAAGSLAVLWLACMVPSGRIGLTGAAGLFPVAAVLAAGRAAGYLCWAASALLGLFLLPDKGVALLYLIFLGLYPVVKNNIEGLRRLPLEWLCKLACFNAALSLFWFALRALFLPDPPVWLGERTWLLYLAGNLIFVLYDVGLSRLIALVMALVVAAFAPGKAPGRCVCANVVGALVLNQVLKFIVQRPRPDGYRLAVESSYSFPSGHSMISMAFYGLLIWMIWKYERDDVMRHVWCCLFGLIIVMVGISRVYLGVHYASDVIAGFCVSLIWLVFFTKVIAPAFMDEENVQPRS